MSNPIIKGFVDEMEKIALISGRAFSQAEHFAQNILKKKALSGPRGAALARHIPKPASEVGEILRYGSKPGQVTLLRQAHS